MDYVISHARKDQRPYLEISILGFQLLGLLDSGASCTIVGYKGRDLLLSLGLRIDFRSGYCTVANGRSCQSSGIIQAPMSLMGKTRLIDILVVPELPHTLILGIDFWKAMNIIPDLRQDVWHFAKDEAVLCSVQGVQSESTLSAEQRVRLNTLIREKFSVMGNNLGCTGVAKHEIRVVPGTRPIKQRYYPVSPHKQSIIDEEVKSMLEKGIIEPSKSGWSSPICLVPKRDGSWRFCIDYRMLNKVTLKDAYPLPLISSILDQLRDARYLSSIDIKSAYWQVELEESSREYTAFTVPGRGLYQFRRMPFGLTNAPATWMRVIDSVLGPELQPSVAVYLDDILIISKDFDSHIKSLELVFDKLHAAGLVVSQEKCQFCLPELRYLGYLVDSAGLRPDPTKVEAILNIPRPQNPTEIRRFIGTASWYRRFIPNFSTLTSPLSALTRKRVKCSWTSACEESFRKIKELLVTASILTCPDFSKSFTLQTDASAYGLGCVLTQQYEDGERVICYLSRSLTRQEQNLSTTERECLAVIWSVEKLRHYLENVRFTVITDHHSLLWLHRLKDPQGRLARWALRLQPYDFEIVHRRGKDNIVPDMLSRTVPQLVDSLGNDRNFSVTTDKWYHRMISQIENNPVKFPKWRVENGQLFKYVKCKIPELADGSDYWKRVVPKDYRLDILRENHDEITAGHTGIYKTFWRIRCLYFWPQMQSDVTKYVKRCKVCAQCKPEQKRPAGLMGSRPVVTQPFELISLDYIGPFPRSSRGHTHVLVVSDYFSKMVLMFPVRSAKSKSLVSLVENNIFLAYGVPKTIMCDNGVQMRSKEFQSLCKNYCVEVFYTASYYPRANPTERDNRVIKTMISCYIKEDHRQWDENLPHIARAICTARHETTGYSPFYILFGREHKLSGKEYEYRVDSSPDDLNSYIYKRQLGLQRLYADVSKRIRQSHEKSKHQYDLRRRPVQYDIGQLVWRKNKCLSDATENFNAKLAPKFVGPFRIRKRTGNWTYELEDDSGVGKGVWHVQDLKPFQLICDEVSVRKLNEIF